MAIHLAQHHATCCASRQLAELPTQYSNKQWPSVQCIMGLCLSTKSGKECLYMRPGRVGASQVAGQIS